MSGAAELGWNADALAGIAESRGWTEPAIERLRLRWHEGQQRVGIPICDAAGERLGELGYDPTGERDPKMRAPNGVPRELFLAPELIAAEDVSDGVVLLVEGEPDAIRAWSLGLPAVGVPGVQSWRDEWAGRLVGQGWQVVVCFDCDTPGRTNAARAAAAIVERGGNARLLDLDPDRSDGYDLTEWARGRDDARRDLLDAAASLDPYQPPTGSESVRVVTAAAFAAVDEPGAAPVVGSADAALVSEGTNVVVYGDGGTGKTTLCIDLGYHLAAGDEWLGLSIPKPRRVLLVENEGSRPLFRRKLGRKGQAWAGAAVEDRVLVLEHPWAEFTFADDQARQLLADKIAECEVDIAVIGPITATGMDAPGTIHEVRAFTALVDEVRTRSGRPQLVIVLIHHENRAGKPSGSWEGVADTLVRLVQRGHGKVGVYFQKVKWASDLHQTSMELEWADGDTFARTEQGPERAERAWDDIAEYVLAHGGCSWRVVEAAAHGTGDYLRKRRDAMLAEGVLINSGEGQGFHLWHREDPARPTLDNEVRRHADTPADTPASATGEGGESEGVSVRRLRSNDAPTDTPTSTSPGAPDFDPVEVERLAQVARQAQSTETCRHCGQSFQRGSGNRGDLCADCTRAEGYPAGDGL